MEYFTVTNVTLLLLAFTASWLAWRVVMLDRRNKALTVSHLHIKKITYEIVLALKSGDCCSNAPQVDATRALSLMRQAEEGGG